MCNGKNEAIMKKIILSLMAVSALFACQKESFTEPSAEATVTFTATVDGADTKTVLDGESLRTKWSGEEWIQIVGSQAYWFGSENITTPSLTASFSYNGGNGEYVETGAVMAVYPAGSTPYTADLSTKTVSGVVIPAKQYPKAGNFDQNAAVAVAYTDNSTLDFKNAVALLKFTIGAENITAACIYANNGGDISGKYSVSLASGAPTLTAAEASQWVDFYPGEGTAFVKGSTYYVAIAPVTFPNGFSVSLGGNVVKTYSSSATFERNVIYNMGTIGTDADSAEPVAPWAVAGAFNDWSSDANPMTLQGDYYVLKNVTKLNFFDGDDEGTDNDHGFKFVENEKDWRGGKGEVDASAWEWVYEQDGVNIYVKDALETAAYDIYLNPETRKYVVVPAGTAMPEDADQVTPDTPTPEPGTFSWGLVGQHQEWDITNPTPMEKVADNVYAVKNITLVEPGFKFAMTGLANWDTPNTHFGAWKKSDGKEYFNFSTEMAVGAWYEVYSNNLGNDPNNIGVSDWTKSYDVYLKIVETADWGQKMAYTVVEHGTTVQY